MTEEDGAHCVPSNLANHRIFSMEAAMAQTSIFLDGSQPKEIPSAVRIVAFHIVSAGQQQGARLSVRLWESTDNATWTAIQTGVVDNLPTPDVVDSMPFAVKPGARYQLDIQGVMTKVWSDAAQTFSLTCALTANGVGAAIEDFKGTQTLASNTSAIGVTGVSRFFL
jgi:hypothetical protein